MCTSLAEASSCTLAWAQAFFLYAPPRVCCRQGTGCSSACRGVALSTHSWFAAWARSAPGSIALHCEPPVPYAPPHKPPSCCIHDSITFTALHTALRRAAVGVEGASLVLNKTEFSRLFEQHLTIFSFSYFLMYSKLQPWGHFRWPPSCPPSTATSRAIPAGAWGRLMAQEGTGRQEPPPTSAMGSFNMFQKCFLTK